MPFGFRGGSSAAYGVKLSIALGETPGVEGIKTLVRTAHSYETFVEVLKSLKIAEWIESFDPRGIEEGVKRWLADRLAKARVYASGLRELIHNIYSLYIGARDLTYLLRLAYAGEEPPHHEAIPCHAINWVADVYHLYLETRSFRGILDRMKTGYLRSLAETIERLVEALGPDGIDIAIDYMLARMLSDMWMKLPTARHLLCPRLDLLYLRMAANTILFNIERDIASKLFETLRPCRLPDVQREVSIGDIDSIIVKFRSTPYGEVTGEAQEVLSKLMTLIRRRSRSEACMGINYGVTTLEFAISALEYLTLDLEDLATLANGVYSGLQPQQLAEIVSVAI